MTVLLGSQSVKALQGVALAVPVLEALATAVPGAPVQQKAMRAKAEEVLSVLAPDLVEKLSVFDTVGIDERYFARPIEWYLEPHGWEDRSKVYAEVGVEVCERASRVALERARLPEEAIDGIVVVSTTGIATPSIDARLANRMGFRSDVTRVPVFGLGCAGGVAGLRIATELARANPGKRYLFLSMELCSLAFNMNDLSVRAFVATTLFADGAAAAIVRGDDVEGASLARMGPAASHQWRNSEDVMGWDVLDDGLRVVFSRRIPEIVSGELAPIARAFLKSAGDPVVSRHVFHPGGTKVLQAYEEALALAPAQLADSREVLRTHGNMSSPTVLFALERSLRAKALAEGETAWLAALGPGFTSEMMLLEG